MTNEWLIKVEAELRSLLAETIVKARHDKDFKTLSSKDYSKAWSQWASLRDEGVKRGLFMFFVPSANDKGQK